MTVALPLFYFRPTICWIDDDPLFLEAVNILLRDSYNCMTFVDSEEALEFLASYRSPLSEINFMRPLVENDSFGESYNLPVNINIAEITQLVDASRKSLPEIALLIADQNMPKLSGLDIFKKLKNTPFKKFLLTGDMNHRKAIDAFNGGLINKFLHKDKAVDELQEYAQELVMQYFYERTENLLINLESSRSSPLSDPIFIDFFKSWCLANKINEFYLLNKQGSFLVKDANGKSHYFVILSDQDKFDFIKLHDDAFEKVGSILEQLAAGDIVPFFGVGKECWEFDFNDWKRFFYPAKTIQGREKYYWAAIAA